MEFAFGLALKVGRFASYLNCGRQSFAFSLLRVGSAYSGKVYVEKHTVRTNVSSCFVSQIEISRPNSSVVFPCQFRAWKEGAEEEEREEKREEGEDEEDMRDVASYRL